MMTDLKLNYFPNRDPESFEFHTTDIISHRGAFKDLSVDVRLNIIEDLLNVVAQMDCHITSVLIRKDKVKNQTLDIGMFGMNLLFERLCNLHDHINAEKSKEEEEYGLLLIDSVDPKYDNKLRIQIRGLCKNGSRHAENRYLIEDPIFVDSKYRHMSQLVDCVAYCIRRKHKNNSSNPMDETTFERFYKIIERRMFVHNGQSIRIFP